MTGPLCFLRMSKSFALTLRIDVLECGEHVTNVLHHFVAEHDHYGKGYGMGRNQHARENGPTHH